MKPKNTIIAADLHDLLEEVFKITCYKTSFIVDSDGRKVQKPPEITSSVDSICLRISNISYFLSEDDAKMFLATFDEELKKVSSENVSLATYCIREKKQHDFTLYGITHIIFSHQYNLYKGFWNFITN